MCIDVFGIQLYGIDIIQSYHHSSTFVCLGFSHIIIALFLPI